MKLNREVCWRCTLARRDKLLEQNYSCSEYIDQLNPSVVNVLFKQDFIKWWKENRIVQCEDDYYPIGSIPPDCKYRLEHMVMRQKIMLI